jgi:hypothetical protein
MSQITSKASSYLEQEQWEKAAEEFYKAANKFLDNKEEKEAIEALEKALSAVNKAENQEQKLDILLLLSKQVKKSEQKKYLKQAIAILDKDIEQAKAVEDEDQLIELLEKKVECSEKINKGADEAKLALGKAYQKKAIPLLNHWLGGKRSDGIEALEKANEQFREITATKEKAEGEKEALDVLLSKGKLEGARKIFKTSMDYALEQDAKEAGAIILSKYISFAKEILLSTSPKRLWWKVKKEYEESPRKGLLLEALNLARNLDANEQIIEISKAFQLYASKKFDKKKHEIALNYYEQALEFLVEIGNKKESKTLADELQEKALLLLDQPKRFETGLKYFSLLNHLKKLAPSYLAIKKEEKAEAMFNRQKFSIAKQDYREAAESYLQAEDTKKYLKIIDAIFNRSKNLISNEDYGNGYLFIETGIALLKKTKHFLELGRILTDITIILIAVNQLKDAQNYAGQVMTALGEVKDSTLEKAKSQRAIGNKYIKHTVFTPGTKHLLKAAELYDEIDEKEAIQEIAILLEKTAEQQLSAGELKQADNLVEIIKEIAQLLGTEIKSEILQKYANHAYNQKEFSRALTQFQEAKTILGIKLQDKLIELAGTLVQKAKKLVVDYKEPIIGQEYMETAVLAMTSINKHIEAAEFIYDFVKQLFEEGLKDQAKPLALRISKVLDKNSPGIIFAEKTSQAAKLIIKQSFIDDGINELRKAVNRYIGHGENNKALELATYCSEQANEKFEKEEYIQAKHLFLGAIEFSSPIDKEMQHSILIDATTLFLEKQDFYSLKEIFDFAQHNVRGEKDYLGRVARLMVTDGIAIKDRFENYDEAVTLIRNGIAIFLDLNMDKEAGETLVAQGRAFLEKKKYLIAQEFIQKGAEIFLEIEDMERSGDAFLILSEANIIRANWDDAFNQLNLAKKAYHKANMQEKQKEVLKTKLNLASQALISNAEDKQTFAESCFGSVVEDAQENDFLELEAEAYLIQGRTYLGIKSYQRALEFFSKAIVLYKRLDDLELTSNLAEEMATVGISLTSSEHLTVALQLIDVATGVFMEIGQPIKASEAYLKACNNLLKQNKVAEGVKLALSATDALMVADELGGAITFLKEIINLLYEIKDYENAAICIGQLVTVYQKEGNEKEQKNAIYSLVEKAKEEIANQNIMAGDKLWQNASNFSLSTSLEFAKEINEQRIANLLEYNMYNSTNQTFKEILPILEDDEEALLKEANRINSIAIDLFGKGELDLSLMFAKTSIEFYRKANTFEEAKEKGLELSKQFVIKEDLEKGIEIIDDIALLANELEGAHEAAKVYLESGFFLTEKGHPESGQIAIQKAIDIEMQAENIEGCIELGEIAQAKATEVAENNLRRGIDIYGLAAKIFEKSEAYDRAGKVVVIMSTKASTQGNAEEAIHYSEKAVDYFLEADDRASAIAAAKHALESARNFLKKGELTKAVLILERGRLFVEQTEDFTLLNYIIQIYLMAAQQFLPDRKSAIGLFFFERALALAKSSPETDEIKKLLERTQQIAITTIEKKFALAGAEILEKVIDLEEVTTVSDPSVSETYFKAIKLTAQNEWNMIDKILDSALRYHTKINAPQQITKFITYLIKEGLQSIYTNQQKGFYFVEHLIRYAEKTANQGNLEIIGKECLTAVSKMDKKEHLLIAYQLIGYINKIFSETNNRSFILQTGQKFLELGLHDLQGNFHSLRGYNALLFARDTAVRVQNEDFFKKVICEMLDLCLVAEKESTKTVSKILKDIVKGLEAYEIPEAKRATIKDESFIKTLEDLTSISDKTARSKRTYKIGRKMYKNCLHIWALTNNLDFVEKEIQDVKDDESKILRRSNPKGAFQLESAGLLLIDTNRATEAGHFADISMQLSDKLLQKKKITEGVSYLETTIALNKALANENELRNAGRLALAGGDRFARDEKIHEAMVMYDLAVKAFDNAKDKERSKRLINMLFQQREWDADVSNALACYRIAARSAIRWKDNAEAQKVATKCFNRGIAFINQPRIPSELAYEFISLAGKTLEDAGWIKQAANAYDNAILKFIKVLNIRKKCETFLVELLIRTSADRMAICDMDSLETIFLRLIEQTDLKKADPCRLVAKVLKLISSGKVNEAWELIASQRNVSLDRMLKIVKAVQEKIIGSLEKDGRFDKTVFAPTERSLPLADYLVNDLIRRNKLEAIAINRDILLTKEKVTAIKERFLNEYRDWGRVEIPQLVKDLGIKNGDIISLIRKELNPIIYMGILDNEQKVYYSFNRLKAELSIIVNRERKKEGIFDPMQVAKEKNLSVQIIKEVLRALACDEVVDSALES